MALDQSALLEVLDALKEADVTDRVRQAAETVYQALIEAELTSVIGAAPHERSHERTALRNGHRTRVLSSTAGDLELRIPKLRTGSFFPALLERRRRVDQALFAVVMEAYLHGVSTRKVDDLVKALGADTGISKSQVSRICADLDEEVGAFRSRSLKDAGYPYVFLDATYCKARVNRRVLSQAVVVATGVRADGHREVLGFDVGDSEDGAFWTAFLRSLKARGLSGVQLVVSDAHEGLKSAIAAVFAGASWQRCRVHFLRNVLAKVPKGNARVCPRWSPPRSARSSPNPTRGTCVSSSRSSPACSAGSCPRVEAMLHEAAEDVLAFTAFPQSHWRKIWSTNPLERVNKEIKRRTDVVGVFPNPEALLRLAGAVLVETHDEWAVTDRRYLSEASMAALVTTASLEQVATPEQLTAKSDQQRPRGDRVTPLDGTFPAPIPVWSGRTEGRVRMTRSGYRQINCGIHRIAVTQLQRRDSPGRCYYDKKLAEGKSTTEALRCLKRRIARSVFNRLTRDHKNRHTACLAAAA